VEVVELSIGGVHWHLLARFVPVGVNPHAHLDAIGVKLTHARRTCARSAYDHDPVPRRLLGLVRTFVTHELKCVGHFATTTGGLWALRPKCEPISCRRHEVATARYIRHHAEQGAAVLSLL